MHIYAHVHHVPYGFTSTFYSFIPYEYERDLSRSPAAEPRECCRVACAGSSRPLGRRPETVPVRVVCYSRSGIVCSHRSMVVRSSLAFNLVEHFGRSA